MTTINLLPWREELRQERERATMILCGLILGVGLIMVYLCYGFFQNRIEHQQSRNQYLQKEIEELSKVIGEIEELKVRRDELLTRMELIQQLQRNRSQIVHMFDDLANKIPKGVLYDKVVKSNSNLYIEGKAQSNGRVSALMRNLDASEWFDDAKLKVVDVIDENGLSVSQFQLDVAEQKNSQLTNEVK